VKPFLSFAGWLLRTLAISLVLTLYIGWTFRVDHQRSYMLAIAVVTGLAVLVVDYQVRQRRMDRAFRKAHR
jgi:hypothetical protein